MVAQMQKYTAFECIDYIEYGKVYLCYPILKLFPTKRGPLTELATLEGSLRTKSGRRSRAN